MTSRASLAPIVAEYFPEILMSLCMIAIAVIIMLQLREIF
jgi:hypothetical protein